MESAMKDPKVEQKRKADVYFNGKFLMEAKSAQEFVENVRKKRRMNLNLQRSLLPWQIFM